MNGANCADWETTWPVIVFSLLCSASRTSISGAPRPRKVLVEESKGPGWSSFGQVQELYEEREEG